MIHSVSSGYFLLYKALLTSHHAAMNSASLDIIFNFLLFLLWFQVWDPTERGTYFNKYLSSISRLSDAIINFFRPVFFSLPPRIIAIALAVLLVVLRGVAAPLESEWIIRFGFLRTVDPNNLPDTIAFSILSFCVFVYQIWGISLIYLRSEHAPYNHAAGSLHHLSLPFSRIKRMYRPAVFIIAGMLIAGFLDATGTEPTLNIKENPELEFYLSGTIHSETSAILTSAVRLLIVSITAFIHIIPLLLQLIIMLIVGSLVARMMKSKPVQVFCHEWTELILGPFRKAKVQLGAIDGRPLLLFIVLVFIFEWSIRLLSYLFGKL